MNLKEKKYEFSVESRAAEGNVYEIIGFMSERNYSKRLLNVKIYKILEM